MERIGSAFRLFQGAEKPVAADKPRTGWFRAMRAVLASSPGCFGRGGEALDPLWRTREAGTGGHYI